MSVFVQETENSANKLPPTGCESPALLNDRSEALLGIRMCVWFRHITPESVNINSKPDLIY